MSMTVRDGVVWFHWCGEKLTDYGALRIAEAAYTPDRVDREAASGSGAFTLNDGDEFSASDPPPGLTYNVSSPISVEDAKTMLFVDIAQSDEDWTGINVQFATDSLARLAPDEWLYPSGEVASKPCEMRNAT